MRPDDPSRKMILANQDGFTLLEIIAVIVIMSILAVVAVPKYFNLQDEARKKAFAAGISEAIGRVNGHFAESVLSGRKPAEIGYNATTLGGANADGLVDMGDFLLDVQDANATITLTITGKDGTEMENVEDLEGVENTIVLDKPGL